MSLKESEHLREKLRREERDVLRLVRDIEANALAECLYRVAITREIRRLRDLKMGPEKKTS